MLVSTIKSQQQSCAQTPDGFRNPRFLKLKWERWQIFQDFFLCKYMHAICKYLDYDSTLINLKHNPGEGLSHTHTHTHICRHTHTHTKLGHTYDSSCLLDQSNPDRPRNTQSNQPNWPNSLNTNKSTTQVSMYILLLNALALDTQMRILWVICYTIINTLICICACYLWPNRVSGSHVLCNYTASWNKSLLLLPLPFRSHVQLSCFPFLRK